MRSFAVFGVAILLAACQSFQVDENTAKERPTSELCKTITAAKYGNATRDSAAIALRELSSRGAFSNSEMENIARGTARPGMSEQAGLCAWGYFWYDLNTTTTASLISKQYVFGDGTYNPRRYLYTENGVVTAIQE